MCFVSWIPRLSLTPPPPPPPHHHHHHHHHHHFFSKKISTEHPSVSRKWYCCPRTVEISNVQIKYLYHQSHNCKTWHSKFLAPVTQMVEHSAWIRRLGVPPGSIFSVPNSSIFSKIYTFVSRKWMLLPVHHWHFKCYIFKQKHICASMIVSLCVSCDTVKPVYNDHLMGYFSAFWSSSRWPRAT